MVGLLFALPHIYKQMSFTPDYCSTRHTIWINFRLIFFYSRFLIFECIYQRIFYKLRTLVDWISPQNYPNRVKLQTHILSTSIITMMWVSNNYHQTYIKLIWSWIEMVETTQIWWEQVTILVFLRFSDRRVVTSRQWSRCRCVRYTISRFQLMFEYL